MCSISKPTTHHEKVNRKKDKDRNYSSYDGSKKRKQCVGRPATDRKIEFLILKMSKENPSWGYSRIVGALSNLGHKISNRTVANILKRN